MVMNKRTLKVQQAVLIAVRKISAAAFNKDLGDYGISFTASECISVLSMFLMKDGEILHCFDDKFYDSGLSPGFQTLYPASVEDIVRFRADVEKGLTDIFKFVEANNE